MRVLTVFAAAGLAAALMGAAVPASAGPVIQPGPSVALAYGPPPPLRVEAQPPMPAYGYIWTPGYWGWDPAFHRYYWTSGVWVRPPAFGALWTPGWWAATSGGYRFTPGYWGPLVGFYGGVDYGAGYSGLGYDGGYWRGRTFFYNRAVTNFGRVHVNAVYDRPALVNRPAGRISFNGGAGGLRSAPDDAQMAAARAALAPATAAQLAQARQAAADPRMRAGVAAAAAGVVAAGAIVAHEARKPEARRTPERRRVEAKRERRPAAAPSRSQAAGYPFAAHGFHRYGAGQAEFGTALAGRRDAASGAKARTAHKAEPHGEGQTRR